MSTIDKEQAMLYQRALREILAPDLKVDGALGQASLIALTEFAKKHAINAPTSFSGPAVQLLDQFIESRYVTDKAYSEAAAELGVPESYVRAVAEVESQGSGFLPDGRLKILFERHWFYKKLGEALKKRDVYDHVSDVLGMSATNVSSLLSAVANRENNICNPVAGGYVGNGGEYARLEKASNYNLEAALQSASYGAYQIMGFNCQACGYQTASEMMRDFATSEYKQFRGFIEFIKGDKNLIKALKAGDWAAFARGYNGPAYAKNKYDSKLQSSEASWAKQLKK